MTALPSQPPSFASIQVINAYNLILQFEKDASLDEDKLVFARILGYLIIKGSDTARSVVATEVLSCANQNEMGILANTYLENFLLPFRCELSEGYQTPPLMYRGIMFYDCDEMKEAYLEKKPTTYYNAKKYALVRQEFKCPVTDTYDDDCVLQTKDIFNRVNEGEFFALPTNAVYIVHPNMPREDEHRFWSIIRKLGYVDIANDLEGKSPHQLQNIIVFNTQMASAFMLMYTGLEPTDKPNTYEVHNYMVKICEKVITFTTPDVDVLPLPSSGYIQLRAFACNIWHLSGARERDRAQRRREEEEAALQEDLEQ